MTSQTLRPIYISDTALQQEKHDIDGEYVSILGDTFYKIKISMAYRRFL